MDLSRRIFLAHAGYGSLALGTLPALALAAPQAGAVPDSPRPGPGVPPAGPDAVVPDAFPTQAPDLVREMVGVAHFDPARVRALLERQPSLARATWDWGFGDWESALGAASHVGHREIAELLLAHGARPDIFSAAMLGHLETVKAHIEAYPGAQRIPGPHGISLLAHARAGAERAAPVLRYLEGLGDADPRVAAQPLAAADLQAILGTYRFGSGARDTLEMALQKEWVVVQRAGGSARRLSHLGDRVFSPAGADAVRIRLSAETPARRLTVHDPDLVVTAERATSG
jgi:hypothetical protein